MQIVLFVIAIVTIVGAWSAWRRSPLYSSKTTLKLAGAFLLIVAAIVGVSMTIFNGPLSLSPEALAISLIAAVMVLSTGAMVLVIRITDAHVAQLPPSVRLVTLHRRKVQRWIWRTVVYLLICAGAAQVLPSSWKWLPLFLGGFMLLLCGPLLAILYMMARRNDRGMSAVIAEPWAHWQYTPAQWESWANYQLSWERTNMKTFSWRRQWSVVLFFVLIFAGGSWFVTDGGVGVKATVFTVCSVLVVLLASGVNWANRGACERRYRRLLAAPPEAWFGAEGLFSSGEYSPWILSGKYLVDATVSSDTPARLVLIFQSFNGSTSVRVAKRIPIPESRESDLVLLQQKLRSSCTKATVRLVAPAP